METVLVTGCAGFIGSHLTEALLKRGFGVVGIDNFDPYYPVELKKRNVSLIPKENFTFIEGDIGEDEVLERAFVHGIGKVFHLAASAGVRNSIRHPTFYCRNDVLNTAKLLEFSKDRGVKKFIFASSSSVYGEVRESELPVRESRSPAPISPYALSKVQGEMWCELYREVYGLDTVSLRFFTVYGPRQRPDEAFTKFITKILRGEHIEIYGDGEQTRDFTYVGDVVNGLLLASEKGSDIYNLGAGNRISVNEMVSIIGSVMGTRPQYLHIEKQQGDVSHTGADISRAADELGYAPRTALEEGTRKQVGWARRLSEDGFVFP